MIPIRVTSAMGSKSSSSAPKSSISISRIKLTKKLKPAVSRRYGNRGPVGGWLMEVAQPLRKAR